MISFQLPGERFQLRAAAIVLHEGFVLLHRSERDDFWSLPGGRVEAGEEAAATIVREMQEELGEAVACGGLVLLVENFFEYQGNRYHEIGLYFLVTLPSSSRVMSKTVSYAGLEGELKLEFRWFPQAELAKLDIRPNLLQRILASADPAFEHLVQRE